MDMMVVFRLGLQRTGEKIDSGIEANTIRRLIIMNAYPRLIRAFTRPRLSARKSSAQGSDAYAGGCAVARHDGLEPLTSS